MLRIAVVSDSHGNFRNVGRMRTECGRLDWMLHAGDHLRDAARIAVNLGVDPSRVRAVVGNCDYPTTQPEELLLELEGVKLYMTHGHKHGVKSNLQRIHLRAQEVGARVAIFGHSHLATLADVGGVLLFNPGSISEPRRAEDPPSCGLLEIESGEVKARHIFFS
ncbi:MAG: YfcE family phosphodiesterase [Bacillota bacterium]